MELEKRLIEAGHACFVLDGDNIRHGLNRDLGFSPSDRTENIRRDRRGGEALQRRRADRDHRVHLALPGGPRRRARDHRRRAVRRGLSERRLDVCEQRDPKGLYAKARAGQIAEFTGVSAPYEPPLAPDVTIDTGTSSLDESVVTLFDFLLERRR